MKIEKDTVVTLNYQVTDNNGKVVDEGARPLVYLHGGYDGIFPALEDILEGKNKGEKLDVRLEPDDAFGEYDEELVRVEPRGVFPDNIEVGMQFGRGSEDSDADEIYTITEISGDKVVVDGNHPLAGVALNFACTIAEVRAATTEELDHAHVHGDHGHQH